MQATPLFLGACAIASFAGAVGGASIDTDPIQRASIGSDLIQRPPIAFDSADTGRGTLALPDHYAMTTPEGRIEIAELATRGLYARRGMAWHEASFAYPPEPAFEEGSGNGDAAFAPEPAESDPAIATADPAAALGEQAAMADETSGGAPRVIDVAATLASRR